MCTNPCAKIVIASALVFVSSFACAQKYPRSLFSVSYLHFDSVREPHGIDWYLKSREGTAIVSAIAANMGIHPSYVQLAMNAVPTAERKGEETFYALPVEPGYAYCAARIKVSSLTPGSGSQASVINANIGPSGKLGIYTWTPVQHLGEGRSWVEGDAQVYGIKKQFLAEFRDKGICKAADTVQRIFNCEGNPCKGGEHGYPADAAVEAPNLTAGW